MISDRGLQSRVQADLAGSSWGQCWPQSRCWLKTKMGVHKFQLSVHVSKLGSCLSPEGSLPKKKKKKKKNHLQVLPIGGKNAEGRKVKW